MYMGLYDWTISRESSITDNVFSVYHNGGIGLDSVYIRFNATRPTFYLKSNIAITSDDGSQNLPYRIELG